MSTMIEKYRDEVVPALKEKLALKNPLTVPRVSKVVVNMGTGAVDKDTLKQLTEGDDHLLDVLRAVFRAVEPSAVRLASGTLALHSWPTRECCRPE